MFCWWCHAVLLVVQLGFPGGLRWSKKGKHAERFWDSRSFAQEFSGDLSTDTGFGSHKVLLEPASQVTSASKTCILPHCRLAHPLFSTEIHICTPQWSSAATCCPEIETERTPPQLCSSSYLTKACSGWHCTFGPEQPSGQAGRTDGLAWQEYMSAMRGHCTAPTQTCTQRRLLGYLKYMLQTVLRLICSEFLLRNSSKGSTCVLD